MKIIIAQFIFTRGWADFVTDDIFTQASMTAKSGEEVNERLTIEPKIGLQAHYNDDDDDDCILHKRARLCGIGWEAQPTLSLFVVVPSSDYKMACYRLGPALSEVKMGRLLSDAVWASRHGSSEPRVSVFTPI
ncbi:unnamed protein product [Protopolystoma xenopodis]|uniref:Uncharacterized protein n=1 Tax=Protopolystoma xenopodis TaxID=117903 RepID=A0A448X744_9PLAT|nr:unnamed protein product [Protopolystoma xenopodis]